MASATAPTRYELAFTEPGRVPDGKEYVARRHQLARIDAHYHSAIADQRAMTPALAMIDGVLPSFGATTRMVLPADRTEYYTPGATQWAGETQLGDFFMAELGSRQYGALTSYRAGRCGTEHWYAAVHGPRLTAPYRAGVGGTPAPWAYRAGDLITVNLPVLSDGRSNHVGYPALARGTDTARTELSRDGTVLGQTDAPGVGEFAVPAGPGEYRLATEVRRDRPSGTLSTRVNAVWTFPSRNSGPDRRALPLLSVDPRVPVDAANSVPAGRPVTFEVHVGRQPGVTGPAVRSLAVDVSYDDGGTWVAAAVRRAGGHWRVEAPAGGVPGGYASLRVRAADAAGSSLDQTVIRAYALR